MSDETAGSDNTTSTPASTAKRAAKAPGTPPTPRKRATRKTQPKPSGPATTKPVREHDLVVFGATGFTGKLVARYLAAHAPTQTRIALAGRSEGRLRDVRAEIGGRVHGWPLIVANAHDRSSVDSLAASTTALVTTVGPYAVHGLELVGACARAGTHYADLTGEVLFMRDSIDRYDAVARASGARVVHSCGFDSIPSDLGVLALHLAAKGEDGVGDLGETHLVVLAMRGGISGGTIQSGLGELDRAKEDPNVQRLIADPYSLSPDRGQEPKPGDPPDPRGPRYDDVTDKWTAPFAMGRINTRVVRRSNAIAGYPYGKQFRYDESMATGTGPAGRIAALGMAGGSVVGEVLLGLGPVRWVAEKVMPDPGEGPGERTREKGYFDILVHSRTPGGVGYRARVAAQGDPGYAATAQMLSVSGLTLAGDPVSLPERAGVLTPATAMGQALIDNLKASGMTITAGRV